MKRMPHGNGAPLISIRSLTAKCGRPSREDFQIGFAEKNAQSFFGTFSNYVYDTEGYFYQ